MCKGERLSSTEYVYSALAFSTPAEFPRFVCPRPKPLLTENCFVFGLVVIVTV